jgi:putative SOS response-associated peptidase YedK
MCNDFGNRVPYDDYLRAFSQSRAPIKFPTAALNLEPRDDIWPTDPAIVIRRREDGVELVQLRWGFPPGRPKGAPIINSGLRAAVFRSAAAWCRRRISTNSLARNHRR